MTPEERAHLTYNRVVAAARQRSGNQDAQREIICEQFRQAIAEERERAAKIVEQYGAAHPTDGFWDEAHDYGIAEIAQAIRSQA